MGIGEDPLLRQRMQCSSSALCESQGKSVSELTYGHGRWVRVNPIFKNAVEFVSETVRMFYSSDERDIEGVVARFADEFSWIGAGELEFFTSSQDIIAYAAAQSTCLPPCEVFDGEFFVVGMTDRTCTVMGRYRVRTDASSGLVLEEHQRCTYELVDERGRMKIGHVHVSNPYQAMKDELYFPFEAGAQSYEYLQELVREKTETLDLIASNINGGFKISEDDECYTLSYVTESLAHMLGYTVEEFFEMSGGTATGASYPPDLPRAYEAVMRCFEKGPSYETEYRVRGKDGALVWILDSGRKIDLADGSTKIVSILMDITSRKQVEEALEIEKERYRIAMRSVTDVLFDYDFEQDVLVEFERPADAFGDEPLLERRYEGYVAGVQKGRWIHPEDADILREGMMGGESGTFELRRAHPDRPGDWRWVRMYATAISDQGGRPVRTIGSWKDVTEEHNRIAELENQARRDPLTKIYNQVAASSIIKEALPGCLERGLGALFVIDIDDFKTVNDTAGHLVGDNLLVDVARAIRNTFVPLDGLAARVGGDEFVAFAPSADRTVASFSAEALACLTDGICVEGRPVTFSFGVAMVGEHGDTYELLFSAADRALYRAKREGKNGMRFAEVGE